MRGYVGDIYQSRSTDPGEAVSPYDAAHVYAAPRRYRGADPVLDGQTRAYGAAFADYARRELNYAPRMTYTLLSNSVNRQWDWDGPRATASAMDDLIDMLALLPGFKVLIQHGYTDALTPYRTSEYLVDQISPELTARRVQLANYRGGHMFYADPASRRAAAQDARRFFEDDGS